MLKIGELKKLTGVPVSTLRYYESLGLLHAELKGDNKYRYFNSDMVQRVLFIRKSQAISLSLTEIKEIIDFRDQGQAVCSIVKNLMDQKIEQLNAEIQELIESKTKLEDYQLQWSSRPIDTINSESVCTFIEELVSLDK